jgi:hypothetical protein
MMWQTGGMKIAVALRISLLITLGLAPVACGGTNGDDSPTCTEPTMYSPVTPIDCREGYSYWQESPLCSKVDPAAASLPRVSESIECYKEPGVCSAFAYGVCRSAELGDEAFCVSGCGIDEDCQDGGRCDCNGNGGHGECRYDECYSDDECEPGYHCASTWLGCGMSAFSCQTARDRCVGLSDCPAGQYCIVKDGFRQCGVSDQCE